MLNSEQTALEGMLLARIGKVREAEEKYRQLIQQDPQPTSLILLASLLPTIYQSVEEIHHWRHRLEEQLKQIIAAGLKQDLERSFAVPDFLAQCQGMNDRPLQELRAQLYTAPQNQEWGKKRERAADGRIRIGLISKYFKDHPIGRLNMGLLPKLPRKDFHVTVLAAGHATDSMSEQFRQHADAYITLPERVDALPELRQMIASLNLDILYYTDIGMDPMTYTLAQSRLSPVQCATWGHPVTTGLPTMDYFISANGLEPDNEEESQHQYTEKLVRLNDLAVSIARPAPDSAPSGRDRMGLPLDARIYGCPYPLYKMHPEFDAILAAILRADPRGMLVLMDGHYVEWKQWLMERFTRTMPDMVRRVKFVASQDRAGFVRLLSHCDVLLDPIHFSSDTAHYDALAVGTPIVTLPSQMLRGRFAYKLYQAMGYLDCVAKDKADYVRIAVELAMNKERRHHAKQIILERNAVLFDNDAGILQLADFFKSIVN